MKTMKELRLKRGYSNETISRKLGISKPHYWQIENNKRRLTYSLAIKIANIYRIYPYELSDHNYSNKFISEKYNITNEIPEYVELKKLKQFRKELGFSIYSMAKELSISPSFYAQIEKGKRRLYYSMIEEIAMILSKNPDELVYDDFMKT